MDRAPIRTATLGTRVALLILALAAAGWSAEAMRMRAGADAAAVASAAETAELRRQIAALKAAPPRVVTERLPCAAPAFGRPIPSRGGERHRGRAPDKGDLP